MPEAAARFRARALSGAQLIYADEAYCAGESERPFYKPDWSPQTLLSCNYMGCPIAVEEGLFKNSGSMRLLPGEPPCNCCESEEALYDFTLRASEMARGVAHIPEVLFSGPMPQAVENPSYVQQALTRLGLGGEAWEGLYPGSFDRRYGLCASERLSIVVRFDGDADALRRTLERIDSARGVLPCDYIVAHEPNYGPRSRGYLQALKESKAAQCIRLEAAGNHARLLNLAASEARGDALLFLPAGAYPQRVDTLERMFTLALLPGVGAVGGKVLGDDGRIISAGLVCGIEPQPVSLYRGYRDAVDKPLQNFYTNCIRNVTAINGALMLSAQTFHELAGFDETLPTHGYMEELCVRLTDHRLHNLYTPYARWQGIAAQSADAISPENRERMRDVFYRYQRNGDGMLTRNKAVLARLQGAR